MDSYNHPMEDTPQEEMRRNNEAIEDDRGSRAAGAGISQPSDAADPSHGAGQIAPSSSPRTGPRANARSRTVEAVSELDLQEYAQRQRMQDLGDLREKRGSTRHQPLTNVVWSDESLFLAGKYPIMESQGREETGTAVEVPSPLPTSEVTSPVEPPPLPTSEVTGPVEPPPLPTSKVTGPVEPPPLPTSEVTGPVEPPPLPTSEVTGPVEPPPLPTSKVTGPVEPPPLPTSEVTGPVEPPAIPPLPVPEDTKCFHCRRKESELRQSCGHKTLCHKCFYCKHFWNRHLDLYGQIQCLICGERVQAFFFPSDSFRAPAFRLARSRYTPCRCYQ